MSFILKALLKRKRVKITLPLTNQPVCGHNYEDFDLVGREEHYVITKGKHADFSGSFISGACKKCNKRAEQNIWKKAQEYDLVIGQFIRKN